MRGTQSLISQQTDSKDLQNHSKTPRRQPVNWQIFLTDLAILALKNLSRRLEIHLKSLEEKSLKCSQSFNTSQSKSLKSSTNFNPLSMQLPTFGKLSKPAKACSSRKKTREKK